MAFNSFVRRAYSSIVRSIRSPRPYQGAFSVYNRSPGRVVGVQFPTSVRFLTGLVHKTAAGESFTNDGLNGLPFDIKDGGLEEGYLTLIRKSPDEIIEVKVRPYYESLYHYARRHYDEWEDALKLVEIYDDEKGAGNNTVEDREGIYPNAHEVETFSRWRDGEKVADIKNRDIEYLQMVVKINFGDEYKKWQKFYVVGYPDKIDIRTMSTSVEGGTEHLEEFEDFLKQRGIEPSYFNSLIDTNFEK